MFSGYLLDGGDHRFSTKYFPHVAHDGNVWHSWDLKWMHITSERDLFVNYVFPYFCFAFFSFFFAFLFTFCVSLSTKTQCHLRFSRATGRAWWRVCSSAMSGWSQQRTTGSQAMWSDSLKQHNSLPADRSNHSFSLKSNWQWSCSSDMLLWAHHFSGRKIWSMIVPKHKEEHQSWMNCSLLQSCRVTAQPQTTWCSGSRNATSWKSLLSIGVFTHTTCCCLCEQSDSGFQDVALQDALRWAACCLRNLCGRGVGGVCWMRISEKLKWDCTKAKSNFHDHSVAQERHWLWLCLSLCAIKQTNISMKFCSQSGTEELRMMQVRDWVFPERPPCS